jgi:hypothetical protein
MGRMIGVLLGGLSLVACAGARAPAVAPRPGPVAQAPPEPTSKSAASTSQDAVDEQIQDKLDPYITCLNTLSSPVHASRARYRSWVPSAGPTGQERTIYGLYDIRNEVLTTCTAGLAKAKALPPSDPKLESAGEVFAKAVTDLDALIDEVYTYYENKSYQDDEFAKGKAIHPQLMAAFDAFSKADNDLHVTLDAITKPLAQRALGRLERKEGKKFAYHRKHVLLTGRELVEAGDPVGEEAFVDGALYSASFSAYDAALTELQGYGAVHENELDVKSNPAWPMAKPNLAEFTRAAEAYRNVSREYLRCLRDAPAKAKTPSGKIDPDKLPPCPDGRPRDVVRKYNEFIRASNDHQFT